MRPPAWRTGRRGGSAWGTRPNRRPPGLTPRGAVRGGWRGRTEEGVTEDVATPYDGGGGGPLRAAEGGGADIGAGAGPARARGLMRHRYSGHSPEVWFQRPPKLWCPVRRRRGAKMAQREWQISPEPAPLRQRGGHVQEEVKTAGEEGESWPRCGPRAPGIRHGCREAIQRGSLDRSAAADGNFAAQGGLSDVLERQQRRREEEERRAARQGADDEVDEEAARRARRNKAKQDKEAKEAEMAAANLLDGYRTQVRGPSAPASYRFPRSTAPSAGPAPAAPPAGQPL